jgi:hypothetical protein
MTSELFEPNETHQERLLRATLREHAPSEVDAEDAWAAIAPRFMFSQGTSASRSRRPRVGLTTLLRTPRAVLIAATLVAVVLVLAAAGFGAAYWGGLFGGPKARLIGNEQLYTTINQSQTIGEVTVTVDKVYADPGNTYISVLIRVPQSVAHRYSHAILNRFGVTNASGQDAAGANFTCDPLPQDGSAEFCLIDYGPFQPNADGTHVTLTVDIGEVWLLRPGVHDPDVRTGPWQFTFTLPFHKQSLGPGGPYAQPGPGRNP